MSEQRDYPRAVDAANPRFITEADDGHPIGIPGDRAALLREAARCLSDSLYHVIHQPTAKGRDRSLAALVVLIFGPTPFGGVNTLREVAVRYGMTEQNLFRLMKAQRDLLKGDRNPNMKSDESLDPSVDSPFRDVAIIGGGCAGTLLTAQLLRHARSPFRITLIDRNSVPGPGVAYASPCAEHRLNVPAGRMSAFPDHPEHFVDWARRNARGFGCAEEIGPDRFLPRWLYGRYLNSVLADAGSKAAPGVSFQYAVGEAIDIHDDENGRSVMLANGAEIPCQAVVLALGLLPGEYPIRRPLPFYRTRRYVHVPLLQDVLNGVSRNDDLLVAGAGLTAVDIIVHCDQSGHEGTIHALSRHGLRPLAHSLQVGVAPPPFEPQSLPRTVREATHRLVAAARNAPQSASDWRAVVDAVRPLTQRLWLGFSLGERARFMRHLRPFWEVHRHRVAPETAQILARMEADGRLRYHAGKLASLKDGVDGAAALIRSKGSEEYVALKIAKVINCTGPRTDYSKYQHPLLINLLAAALIDHDPLALGINALPTGEVLRYGGLPSGWLFTLGAALKGVLWECTAVAEIRVMAESLASRLLGVSQADDSGVVSLASRVVPGGFALGGAS